MAATSKCFRCGSPLAADAADGQCPACLLGLALLIPPAERGVKRIPVPSPGLPGRFFADYELLEEIARGGMGVVYRARQLSLKRWVALKMLLDGPLASKGFVERFQIEAEAAAKLNHPNIVPIYEIGEHQGRHFFSMELFQRGDLRGRLADFVLPMGQEQPGWGRRDRRSRDDPRQQAIARLICAVARAVQHAHERGILHRDLKPANILFDEADEPHVTDFGLAKLVADESYLTQSGTVMGTPAYMAPEQASTGVAQLTTGADIYSLGAILYHLLAGRPAFQAGTALETMRRVIEEDPIPPDRVNPRVDQDLGTIALKCLQKNPARRYTSARALAQELESWSRGDTIVARPATRLETWARWWRRNPALAGLAIVVPVLLLAVVWVSVASALRIERARKTAVAAERTAVSRLWESYLDQARARRWSGRSGRRVESLRAITNAVAIRPSLELRNEAIAALALSDLYPIPGAPRSMQRTDRIAIDFSHDRYLLARNDGFTSIQRLGGGMELAGIAKAGSGLEQARFSADGRRLLLNYQDGSVRVWDVAQARYVCEPVEKPETASLSPGGEDLVYSTADNRLVIISMTNAISRTIRLPTAIIDLCWRPDGKAVAGIGERQVLVVDCATGAVRGRFPFSKQPLAIAWHPDGERLAEGGEEPIIRVLNVTSAKEVAQLEGHLGAVTGLNFSPDGRLLASDSWDGTLRLWDSATLKNVDTVRAGPERIEFSPDGSRLAVYSWAGSRVELFEVLQNRVSVDLAPPGYKQRQYGGCALLFGQNADWLAVSEDSSLDLWNAASGQPLARWDQCPSDSLQRLPGGAGLFGWTPGGFYRLIFDGTNRWPENGRLQRFIPAAGPLNNECPAELFTRFGPDSLPERSSASLDGRVVGVAYREHCYVFAMDTGRVQAISGAQPWMKFVSVSPDGRWVATGGWHNPNVKIWSAATGQLEQELPTDTMPNVAFSPDGRWLVTSTGQQYCFWHTGDWRPARRIERFVNGDLPGPMAFSRDGKMLALTGTTRNVHLIAPETGELLAEFEPVPDNEIIALAFNQDGSELALTRVGAPPQIWHVGRIRKELAGLGLDW